MLQPEAWTPRLQLNKATIANYWSEEMENSPHPEILENMWDHIRPLMKRKSTDSWDDRILKEVFRWSLAAAGLVAIATVTK